MSKDIKVTSVVTGAKSVAAKKVQARISTWGKPDFFNTVSPFDVKFPDFSEFKTFSPFSKSFPGSKTDRSFTSYSPWTTEFFMLCMFEFLTTSPWNAETFAHLVHRHPHAHHVGPHHPHHHAAHKTNMKLALPVASKKATPVTPVTKKASVGTPMMAPPKFAPFPRITPTAAEGARRSTSPRLAMQKATAKMMLADEPPKLMLTDRKKSMKASR